MACNVLKGITDSTLVSRRACSGEIQSSCCEDAQAALWRAPLGRHQGLPPADALTCQPCEWVHGKQSLQPYQAFRWWQLWLAKEGVRENKCLLFFLVVMFCGWFVMLPQVTNIAVLASSHDTLFLSFLVKSDGGGKRQAGQKEELGTKWRTKKEARKMSNEGKRRGKKRVPDFSE